MPRCKTHTDRESLARCSACGVAYCGECLVEGAEPALCIECSIAAAGQLVGSEVRTHHAPEAVAPWRKAKRRSWIRTVAVSGLILIAAEAVTILLLRPSAGGSGDAAGATHRGGAKAQLIMRTADLLLIRSRLENQYLRTGTLPESLLNLELPPEVKEEVADGKIRYEEGEGEGFTLRSSDSPVPIRGGAAPAPGAATQEESP